MVVDTTGSLIYLTESLLEHLSGLARMVYLSTPPSFDEQMLETFLSEPKPVIWRNSFSSLANEPPGDSLRRCYPQLMEYRRTRYARWADQEIEAETLRQPGFHENDLLALVQKNKIFT